MAVKLNELIISYDDSLENVDGFAIVKKVIKTLSDSGILNRMSGNCIGACEIIGNMLYQKGIKSYMIETQLTFTNSDGNTTLVGYDNFLSPDLDYLSQIDTHTVLIVTLDDTQMLLDPSIGYLLPSYHPIILEKINGGSLEIVSEYNFKDSNLVYTSKLVSKLPHLTQQNLVSNILKEDRNSKKLNALNKILYLIGVVSLLNVLFNILLLILK